MMFRSDINRYNQKPVKKAVAKVSARRPMLRNSTQGNETVASFNSNDIGSYYDSFDQSSQSPQRPQGQKYELLKIFTGSPDEKKDGDLSLKRKDT